MAEVVVPPAGVALDAVTTRVEAVVPPAEEAVDAVITREADVATVDADVATADVATADADVATADADVATADVATADADVATADAVITVVASREEEVVAAPTVALAEAVDLGATGPAMSASIRRLLLRWFHNTRSRCMF